MKEERNWENRICPFLGQKSDPDTALSYPSELNCCARSKAAAAIPLGLQVEYCLTSRHASCERYATAGAPLPADLQAASARRRPHKRRNQPWLWGILLLTLGALLAGWLFTRGAGFNLNPGKPSATEGSIATGTNTEIPPTFVAPTKPPLPTPVPTLAPILAGSATPRPLLGLETALGVDHRFVIHQIKDGESRPRIASNHGTTEEALVASNYRLNYPLLTGWMIVVPLNFVDVEGFPAFEVYGVTEEISLEDLATRLSVDLAQFKYYNALSEDFIPRIGDWFLVPRFGKPSP